MRKLTLLIIVLFSIGFTATKFNPYAAPADENQIIKFNDIPYDGQRLYIGPVATDATRSELKFTISNTGRKDIRLGGGYDKIVINLDPSFQKLIAAGSVLTGQVMELGKSSSTSASTSKPKKEKETKSKSKKPTPTESKKEDKNSGTVVLESPEKEGDSKRSKFLNPDDCPDLMIKDIEIIKVNKYMIAIEYTVKNQGTGTAEMHGAKSSTDDNMFLKAYLSATPKFSRSAKTIGETAVKKEMGNKEGTLAKSREFKGKMYMNVRGRTAMTPYLILTLDPYQTVRECNERNNRSYIKLPE